MVYVLYTHHEANSMEQSPSWQANSFTASQEISHILWNSKVQYQFHKFPQLVPVLCQINQIHALVPILEGAF